MLNHTLILTNFTVEIGTESPIASQAFIESYPNIKNETNPRQILSIVESIPGISSTTIRKIDSEDIVLSSGVFLPEENQE